jgi:hypothetical protein
MIKNDTAALLAAAQTALQYIATKVTYCDGRKCREKNCEGCSGEDYAAEAAQLGQAAALELKAAIDAMIATRT